MGLITFRKMLQRRVAIIIYRRRLGRIRAWFVNHYPPVLSGLPYSANENLKMDWRGKNELGSTAFSVAFINTALILLSILAIGLILFGAGFIVWIVLVSIVSGVVSWLFHLAWKNKWMRDAEIRDEKALQELEQLKHQQPQSNFSKQKRN